MTSTSSCKELAIIETWRASAWLWPDSIWDFRIHKLKEMGCNAYRCVHNPPANEFFEACDCLGLLVMDENRDFGSSPENLKELDWMVRRDRNLVKKLMAVVFSLKISESRKCVDEQEW
jgi:hypothetical protein